MRYCFMLGTLMLAGGLVAGGCLAAEVGSEAVKTGLGAGGPPSDRNTRVSIGHLSSAVLHALFLEACATCHINNRALASLKPNPVL